MKVSHIGFLSEKSIHMAFVGTSSDNETCADREMPPVFDNRSSNDLYNCSTFFHMILKVSPFLYLG